MCGGVLGGEFFEIVLSEVGGHEVGEKLMDSRFANTWSTGCVEMKKRGYSEMLPDIEANLQEMI